MKNSLISRAFNRARSRAGSTGRASRSGSSEEVIRSAERYFAEEYPNPKRLECPQPERYSDLIRNRQLPGEELRRHLLTCSECFRDYQAALGAQRETDRIVIPATPKVVFSFASAKALTIAFATLLVVITTVGIMVWVRSPGGTDSYQVANSSPGPSIPAEISSPTPPPSTGLKREERGVEEPQRGATPKTSPEQSVNRVQIDLESSSRSRGTNRSDARATTLAAGHNDVVIKLSSGSPKGTYQVTLADPFGNPIVSSSARSSDGTILRAALKLDAVKAGKYLICVTREAEVPDCVPALVIAR